MINRPRALLFVSLSLLVAGRAGAADVPAEGDQLTPVLASVLAVPVPGLMSDGRWVLPYELELVNVADVPMTIESVEVHGTSPTPIATLSGSKLAAYVHMPGSKSGTTLAPGQSAVLLVNLDFARREDIPATVDHRIALRTAKPHGAIKAHMVERVAATPVSAEAPIVIGPPLRGGRWVAAASCCDSYHRRAVLPIDGKRRVAQRFAIDWLMLDAAQRLADGDPKQNRSWPQYGQEVLAVADGTVVRAVDGLPDGVPGKMPTDTTLANADGNSVVLDLGGGRFALFAHLQPGSVRVHEGDQVARGHVLGLVGNSGNSDAPHLHFHVMDSPSPLASNGLPYAIDHFDQLSVAISDDDLETALKTPHKPVATRAWAAPTERQNQLPAELAIIQFPN